MLTVLFRGKLRVNNLGQDLNVDIVLSSCSDPSEITDTTHDSRAWNQRFTVWITVYLIIFPYRLPVNSATHLWKLHTCILISRYDYKSVSSRIIRHTKHSTFNRVDLLFIFYACYEIISFLCRIWHKNYFIFTLLTKSQFFQWYWNVAVFIFYWIHFSF